MQPDADAEIRFAERVPAAAADGPVALDRGREAAQRGHTPEDMHMNAACFSPPFAAVSN